MDCQNVDIRASRAEQEGRWPMLGSSGRGLQARPRNEAVVIGRIGEQIPKGRESLEQVLYHEVEG